jgi:hypothetical protein
MRLFIDLPFSRSSILKKERHHGSTFVFAMHTSQWRGAKESMQPSKR